MTESDLNPQAGIWSLVGRTLVAFNEKLDGVRAIDGVRDSELAHVDA